MEGARRRVVIVGGGTAGWLTAGIIAARHTDIEVTLMESPNVRIIGVGEGTWPTMRGSLRRIGVRETDFFRQCDASFKQGSQFIGWRDGRDSYYHPFTLPRGYDEINPAPYWQKASLSQAGGGDNFADAVCFQTALCDGNLAPKQITTPEYGALANYAYHLDAGKFATFLRDHCVARLGVKHILADVTRVEGDDTGHIVALHSDGHAPVPGDLFVDCTGFLSLLLGKHYGVTFKSCADQLFIDSALAIQVPYVSDDVPIASVTLSTAQRAGWIWDVGLPTRRGVGHVYSGRFTSDDQALEDLKAYLGTQGAGLKEGDVRKIPINSGHRDTFWVKNCVAVGLAAGFVEPLEASSIVMTELAAQMIADQMPANRAVMPVIARRFNETFTYRWQRIIEFLKLHYVLSRRDEPFWLANRDPASIPENLQDLLTLWQYQFPWHDDLVRKDEVFPTASYQYVLYGMGFHTADGAYPFSNSDSEKAQAMRLDVARARSAVTGQFPSNRDLLARIRTYGMQTV